MIKYLGAVAALALWSGAAEARVVTIEYASTTNRLNGDVSGRFTFDTRTASRRDFSQPGTDIAVYTGTPPWQHSFDLFGETRATQPLSIDVSSDAFLDIISFYSQIPETTDFIVLSLFYPLGANINRDLPDSGFENATFGVIAFFGQPGFLSQDLARYSVSYANSVPEPATWAMMIGGIGMVGGALRRRSRNALAAAA